MVIELFVKRMFDIIISLLMIILFSPVLLLMAVLIKIESKGPAIYKQQRVGKNEKLFTAYKYQTMYQNSSIGNLKAPQKGDPRVTKIGYFLRKTSLDELAQLFNVLNNTMSIIGPRAVPQKELELRLADMLKYEPTQKELFEEYFKIRARVKPGITGMAQAYGRSSLTTKKATELDVYYVEHFSLWLDIKIIFKTIHTVLFQKGVN